MQPLIATAAELKALQEQLTGTVTTSLTELMYGNVKPGRKLILTTPLQPDPHDDEYQIFGLEWVGPVGKQNLEATTTNVVEPLTNFSIDTIINLVEALETGAYTIAGTVTPELLSKHFKGVRFKEITTDEQTFVDRVLATCFNDTDSSASWITKVEEARTDREQWYVIYKINESGRECDLVLNGVCVRTALNFWNLDIDADMSPALADHFLKDCLYGPDHRKAN